LARKYEIHVQRTVFPLHPDVPVEGMTLAELFRVPEHQLAEMRAHMENLMAAEELPYGDRTHTYNSRLAQELAKWADATARGSGIHRALYRAYFVDNTNLADPEALIRVAASVGLPASEAREVVEGRLFREAVDADWQRARAMGVTGVPTFVVGDRGVVGAQPYEVLVQLVLEGGR
jgi:predicted DsbA family dithiol-disulfide isomerase